MEKQALYQIALETINPLRLRESGEAGHVACALETSEGKLYTGICIDLPCSIGFCAEQAAIAAMVKHGETCIKQIIAVYEDGSILPPCGRCREFISQIDQRNLQTMILLSDLRSIKLAELLPERWDEKWDSNN